VDHRRALGVAGENAVAEWYARAGYAIVDRNWRCREGELDLVVARAGTIVFCEVKTRRGAAFGAPFEAVTFAKQRRLRTLALQWLAAHPEHRAPTLRFDVASVVAVRGSAPAIDVIEAAF
jgi:putative endonuclease